MASLRSASPRLRNYFKDKYIPQVYEALLCGLLVTCPEDPLRYLEEMIIYIINNGLENLLWDMCIDPSMRPRIRRLSQTYLEQLFGLDNQLVTPELMVKACNIYTGHLLKSHFCSWKEAAMPHANQEAILAEKVERAAHHYHLRCQKLVLRHWHGYVKNTKEILINLLARLREMFCTQRQRIILAKWRERVKMKSKMREDELVFNHELQLTKWKCWLKSKEIKFLSPEQSCSDFTALSSHFVFDISALPERAIMQIFLNLTFRDKITCGQVNRSWMSMIKRSFLWNAIDFSTSKHVSDKCAVTALQKWRINVLHLNFQGCNLQSKALKAVSKYVCHKAFLASCISFKPTQKP